MAKVKSVRSAREADAKIARIGKIIERIEEIPRGPLLTPGELHDKNVKEAVAKILGQCAPAGEEDVRPRWAATERADPPWKETTSADSTDSVTAG